MRRTFVVMLSVLALVLTTRPATAKSDEEMIRMIEQDWATALQKADVAAIDKIELAEWTLADPEGNLLTKAQADAEMTTKNMVIETFHVDDLKVTVHGDTAIAHGLETEKSTYKGKDTSGQYRFTDVFVKKDGRWQALATHVSRVAKP